MLNLYFICERVNQGKKKVWNNVSFLNIWVACIIRLCQGRGVAIAGINEDQIARREDPSSITASIEDRIF